MRREPQPQQEDEDPFEEMITSAKPQERPNFPPIQFRYCFEVNRIPNREALFMLESVQPEEDHFDHNERTRITKFQRASIMVALEIDGITKIEAIRYYSTEGRVWHNFPGLLALKSNQCYMVCSSTEPMLQGTELREQGLNRPWIVDLLIREGTQPKDSQQKQMARNAETRIDQLENLIFSIGSKIMAHFGGNHSPTIDQSRLSSTHMNDSCHQHKKSKKRQKGGGDTTVDNDNNSSFFNETNHNSLVDDDENLDQPTPINQNEDEKDPLSSAHLKESAPSQRESKKSSPQQKLGRQLSKKAPKNNNRRTSGKGDSNLNELHSASQKDMKLDPKIFQNSLNSRQKNKNEKTLDLEVRSISMFEHSKFPRLTQYPSIDESMYSLDLAFLYADPLLQEISIVDQKGKEIRKQIEPFNQPLGTDQEFEKIKDSIKKANKRFSIMKEVANNDNLQTVLGRRPIMLHISCHGDCYWDTSVKPPKNTFFLAFEGNENQLCMLDQLTEERLRNLLGQGESSHRLLIVFVSACHSESIGQLFKRVGVPVVIAVNSHTAILDDVCKQFARHFYQQLAFGETPLDSFKAGLNVVKSSRQDLFSCCCAHKHKAWCKWRIHFSKKENTKDKDAPHNAHIPNSTSQNCKCHTYGYKYNQHRRNCQFAKTFAMLYVDTNQEVFQLQVENTIQVCCCSPDLPHDETQKLKIIERSYENEECPKEIMPIKNKMQSMKVPEPSGFFHEQLQKSSSDQNQGLIIGPQQLPQILEIQHPNLAASPPLRIQNDQEGSTSSSDDTMGNQQVNQTPNEKEARRQFERYENQILRTPIFKNREQGSIDVQGVQESVNQLKSQIDHKMLIGRNMLIKQIVEFLNNDESRLLHVYGEEGLGEADIVNYASKYALYGRITLDGALYVEANCKNSINGLIQTICQRLSEKTLFPKEKNEYSRENLIGFIQVQKLLIIIDKTRELIEESAENFNEFLRELVQKTHNNKFIIISTSKNDLMPKKFEKVQLEVPYLTKKDAASLLFKVAKTASGMSTIKQQEDLIKHKILNIFPLKPQVIIQLGTLLETKSLDQLVEEDERMKKQEEERRKQMQIEEQHKAEIEAAEALKAMFQRVKQDQKDEIFDPEEEKYIRERSQSQRLKPNATFNLPQQQPMELIMKLSFEVMLQHYPVEKYPPEYELIYILCQMPKGLQDIDMEEFCEINSHMGDWRRMFHIISEDYEGETPNGPGELPAPPDSIRKSLVKGKEQEYKRFKFLKITIDTTNFLIRYEPIPMFRDFINKQLAEKWNINQQSRFFNEAIKYLAQLSRRLLLQQAALSKNDIDIKNISATLNEGIWESAYKFPNKDFYDMFETPGFQPMVAAEFDESPILGAQHHMRLESTYWRYEFHEANFVHFLNLKQLLSKYSTLNYKEDSVAGDLQELAICTISMMIELRNYQEAGTLIEKCDALARNYNIIPLMAKLVLLNSTLQMKQKDNSIDGHQDKIDVLRTVSSILKKDGSIEHVSDCIADSLFHQAILQIERFNFGLRKAKIGGKPIVNIQSAPSQQMNLIDQSVTEKTWNDTLLHNILQTARDNLNSARRLYAKANVNFGVAKASLIEAEFLIDILQWQASNNPDQIMDTQQQTESLLKDSLQVFKDMKLESLEARVLKNLGYMKFKQYTYDQQRQAAQGPSLVNNNSRVGPMGETPGTANLMGSQFNDLIVQEDLIEELNQCKEYFKQAKKIFERIRDENQIIALNDHINQVLKEVRKNSSNVLIFAKAFPLVEDPMHLNSWDQMYGYGINRASGASLNNLLNVNNWEVRQIGALTRTSTNFRKKMIDRARQSNQSLNIKFDLLNREILQYAVLNGCKILHISSHAFDLNRLCIEGANGLVDYLTINQIKNLVYSSGKQCLDVELVVLAIPMSCGIAQAFLSLGVKHVVCFNLEAYCGNQQLVPKVFDAIYNFCLNFYSRLFRSLTVDACFMQALSLIYDDLKFIAQLHNQFEIACGTRQNRGVFEAQNVDSWAYLYPYNNPIHRQMLFKGEIIFEGEESELNLGEIKFSLSPIASGGLSKQRSQVAAKKGKVIDSTLKKRRPNNLTRFREATSFTGRRCLIYNLITELRRKQVRLVNLHGPEGIGKSRLVIETATYLSERDVFKDGIFYVDLNNVVTKEEFIKKTMDIIMKSCNIKEESVLDQQLEANNILLIMDQVDSMMQNKSKFDWDVINLINLYKNMKIIVVTREEIDLKLFEKVKEGLVTKELPPLDIEESIDLVLSNCHRLITEDFKGVLKGNQANETFYETFQKTKQITICGGFPKYLVKLANQLNSTILWDIKIRELIQQAGGNIDEISKYHKKYELIYAQLLKERESQQIFPMQPPQYEQEPFEQADDGGNFFDKLSQEPEIQKQGVTPQGMTFEQQLDARFNQETAFMDMFNRRPSQQFGHGRVAEKSSTSSLIGRQKRLEDLEEEKVPLDKQQQFKIPETEEEQMELVLQMSLREFQEKESFMQAVAPALSRQASRGDSYSMPQTQPLQHQSNRLPFLSGNNKPQLHALPHLQPPSLTVVQRHADHLQQTFEENIDEVPRDRASFANEEVDMVDVEKNSACQQRLVDSYYNQIANQRSSSSRFGPLPTQKMASQKDGNQGNKDRSLDDQRQYFKKKQ